MKLTKGSQPASSIGYPFQAVRNSCYPFPLFCFRILSTSYSQSTDTETLCLDDFE